METWISSEIALASIISFVSPAFSYSTRILAAVYHEQVLLHDAKKANKGRSR